MAGLLSDDTAGRAMVDASAAVLRRHGIVAPTDVLRRELQDAVRTAIGDPPFVDGSFGVVEYGAERTLQAFADALECELREQARRRATAPPSDPLTRQQGRLLGLDGLRPGNGECLAPSVLTGLTLGALHATGLTAPEAASLLRCDERTVSSLVRDQRLYSVPEPHAPPTRLPLFQFHADGPVPMVQRILPELGNAIHPVGVFNWFTSPNPDLALPQTDFEPTSPRDWLTRGNPSEPVRQLAASVTVGTPT